MARKGKRKNRSRAALKQASSLLKSLNKGVGGTKMKKAQTLFVPGADAKRRKLPTSPPKQPKGFF